MWTEIMTLAPFNVTLTPGGIEDLHHSLGETSFCCNSVHKFVFSFAILMIPVSVFGCVGNILSLLVLAHHRMRNTTNYCLAALAVSDFLVLLSSLWYSAMIIYRSRDPVGAENLRRLTYPFIGVYGSVVTARITSWLTALLSIERFIAVYCPMKARSICSKRQTSIAIILIYILTIVFFLPLSLKYYPETVTKYNQTIVILKKTALGQNKHFSIIFGTVLNILFRFAPITLQIILNILIVRAIKRTWSLRRIMSKNGNHCNMSEQNRITVMLLVVSFVFLLGITPGAISSIASKIQPAYSRLGAKRDLYACVSSVTYFMETANSAINFVIYMAYSAKFCRTYKEIFCCRQPNISRNVSKEIIRFSKRPGGSVCSSGTHESRLSGILGDSQKKNNSKRTVSVTSSFELDHVKLLGQRSKQSSMDGEGNLAQFN